MDSKYRIQAKVTTVPKKTLFLVLLYLGPLSSQTTTKLEIVFKSQDNLATAFSFKDRIPRELTSGVVYKTRLIEK